VFIADNIKEVIPEFLMLLKGVIDCPDLPLNVSRSALQNDGFVKKIADYITKKVADKLSGMCKTERENYEKYWDDISPFIKFGCLKDEKFCEKITDYILFKNLDGKYFALPEALKVNDDAGKSEEPADTKTDGEEDGAVVSEGGQNPSADEADKFDDLDDNDEKEPDKRTIFYVTDEQQQSQYIRLFKEQGLDAFILTHNIDQPFITQLEHKNEKIKFQRIDAELTDEFKEEFDESTMKDDMDRLTETFRKALHNDKLDVKVTKLKNADVSAVMTLSEESRRMQDMMRMYNMGGSMDPDLFGGSATLVLNANHALVQYVLHHSDSEHVDMFCEQLYDLAMISHKPLSADAMSKFIKRSNDIMMMLAK
jgi:molecular chaperone HtpG